LEPETAAKVLLHELGHIECKHVGPVTVLNANPPAFLRAVWASDAKAKENEADCWAALRWAELSGLQRQVLGGLARPEGDNGRT
jgi:Zn-dependent protease with chaperone function